MILIKLGGSIITNKGKPESARRKTIDSILKQIKKINEPMILVHGGGSYGHYWSVKYGMHTKPAKYSLKGLSVVKNSMIELDKIILDSAAKNRLNTYSVPPTDFMNGNKPIRGKIQKIGEIAKSGLVPVTYGDALWYGQKKSYILSGDVIMTTIGKILNPRLSIFVLDVDGVYSDTKSKKYIINDEWIFFSNYESNKAQQFNENNNISATLYWKSIDTQIRIQAKIYKSSKSISDEHFISRNNAKNALAISSSQSRPIKSYNEVIKNYKNVLNSESSLNRPDYWGGFSFFPYSFEFWKGHDSRINKRYDFNR